MISLVHVLIGLVLISFSLMNGCAGMQDRTAAVSKYIEPLNQVENLKRYRVASEHKAWATASNGRNSWAAGLPDVLEAIVEALKKCRDNTYGNGGQDCRITNIDGLSASDYRRRERQAAARRLSRKKKDKQVPNKESIGTGFFVGKPGFMLTNLHVVSDCSVINVLNKSYKSEAQLSDSDPKNDLAVLIVKNKNVPAIARFRSGKPIRIGDDITVVGYPLGFVLGTGIKATTGNVSAMTGFLDDVSQMQISAPIQPGNSGGPVLDRSGNVVGVIVAKLNEIKVAQAIGSIPQNVNFAIKSIIAQLFLRTNRIEYEQSVSEQSLEIADIVEQATKYTAQVQCGDGKQ